MRREIIPYEPHLKELARKLRTDSTLSEILLWKRLKGRQMHGYDFHRQKPILSYIVDFYCSELKLAIEIDGISHDSEAKWLQDLYRQNGLEQLGITVLRFHDLEVKKNIDVVVSAIEFWIVSQLKEHTPNPSQEGRHTPNPPKEGSKL